LQRDRRRRAGGDEAPEVGEASTAQPRWWRSAASTLSMLTGLVMKRSMSARSQALQSASVALAVRATMGIRGRPWARSTARIRRTASRPSISGIGMSIHTRSKGPWSRQVASASAPLPAMVQRWSRSPSTASMTIWLAS